LQQQVQSIAARVWAPSTSSEAVRRMRVSMVMTQGSRSLANTAGQWRAASCWQRRVAPDLWQTTAGRHGVRRMLLVTIRGDRTRFGGGRRHRLESKVAYSKAGSGASVCNPSWWLARPQRWRTQSCNRGVRVASIGAGGGVSSMVT
jgi:hypothetical protein